MEASRGLEASYYTEKIKANRVQYKGMREYIREKRKTIMS
jgi:hypothetical protein